MDLEFGFLPILDPGAEPGAQFFFFFLTELLQFENTNVFYHKDRWYRYIKFYF